MLRLLQGASKTSRSDTLTSSNSTHIYRRRHLACTSVTSPISHGTLSGSNSYTTVWLNQGEFSKCNHIPQYALRSIGCPGPNPGGPFLCNASTWAGDPERLARALGKKQLDWISTDEYYDVSPAHYREIYQTRLYPYLRPEQRIILLPFAAYCEIGCQVNHTMAPVPADQRCLGSAEVHLQWAQSDNRVIGMFVPAENPWQRTQ